MLKAIVFAQPIFTECLNEQTNERFAQDQTAGKFWKEALNPKCYNPKHRVHFFHYTSLMKHPPKGKGTQFCIILS